MARQTPPAFASSLDQLRRARGLSFSDLARALNVSVSQVSRWCRGETTPSIDAIATIANYFSVDRETMERLAGYRANMLASEQDSTIDPEMAAMADAEYAEMLRRLESGGYPRPFWTQVMRAWRQMADMADALTGTISSPSDGELADEPPTTRDDPNPPKKGANGRLTDRQLVGVRG